MAWPPSPGPGPFPLPLATPAYYVLVLLLGLFVVMLWYLHNHSSRKRALDGFFEAAGIDLAFLVFSVAVVTVVALHDPSGNRTSRALYEMMLGGYWLAFSIPIVTIGSSVEHRTRGSAGWLTPSLVACGVLFLILFVYYYGHP